MPQNWTVFEDFLWESFCEGQAMRELRLSDEELQYLKARYPVSSCAPRGQGQDGKSWYLVTLRQGAAFCHCG